MPGPPATMPGYLDLLALIAPVFAVVIVGGVARRLNILNEEADTSLMKLTLRVLYPSFIFTHVCANEELRTATSFWVAPLLGFGTICLGFAVAWLAGGLLHLERREGLRTFAFTTGIYNYIYLPIPILGGLFGKDAIGMLLIFNLGTEAAIWTVGMLLLAGTSLRESWRSLINAPLIALLLGLLFNRTGWAPAIPQPISATLDLLAAAAIPLGLLLIGATIASFTRRAEPTPTGECTPPAGPALRAERVWDPAIWGAAVIVRLAILPILFLALAMFLPLSTDIDRVLLVQAAMPAGIMPLVIARHYGGKPLVALGVILATTGVAIFLIPWWIATGRHLLGV